MNLRWFLIAATLMACWIPIKSSANQGYSAIKVKDLVIYQSDAFYSSFPSIVRRPDGELLVAFRRAPDRRRLGETGYTHTDPNSYLMLVRSKNGGETWSQTPELLYAHPFGGSQDPCMVQLSDNSILCTSYGWAYVKPEIMPKMTNVAHVHNYASLGGYILRSVDNGHHWDEPIVPPALPGTDALDLFGKPLPALNRGAMCEGENGKLYWVVIRAAIAKPEHTATHLLISSDKGKTWEYSCPVAQSDKVVFNETSMYETPKGDLVAFMRTANLDDHATIARSIDGGKSFLPWQDMGFQGHPLYAMRLPDKQVLLVYGYRHPPFGIRARILDPECDDFTSATEIVLRDDGGNGDLGYPWATMISKTRALVVYYFNQADGPRYIAGTLLEIKSRDLDIPLPPPTRQAPFFKH